MTGTVIRAMGTTISARTIVRAGRTRRNAGKGSATTTEATAVSDPANRNVNPRESPAINNPRLAAKRTTFNGQNRIAVNTSRPINGRLR